MANVAFIFSSTPFSLSLSFVRLLIAVPDLFDDGVTEPAWAMTFHAVFALSRPHPLSAPFDMTACPVHHRRRRRQQQCCRRYGGLWHLFLILLLVATRAASAVNEEDAAGYDDAADADAAYATTILDLLSSELHRRPANGGFVWHQLRTNVLRESSGVLRNGELTVILGPSGSGEGWCNPKRAMFTCDK
jgi:hypothetical protein